MCYENSSYSQHCLLSNTNLIAASAHARAAIYFEIDKDFPCRFVYRMPFRRRMRMIFRLRMRLRMRLGKGPRSEISVLHGFTDMKATSLRSLAFRMLFFIDF